LAADCYRSALEDVQCNAGVGGVEQTVERSTAGAHAHGHRRLGKAIPLHGGFDLIGEDLFDGLFLALFQMPCSARKLSNEEPTLPFLPVIRASPLPQQRAAPQNITRIEPPLYGAHLLDIRGAILQFEQVPLAFPEAVFGRHRAAKRDRLAGEVAEELAGARGIGRVGEDVEVNVRLMRLMLNLIHHEHQNHCFSG